MALDGARNQCQCMKQQLATHQGKNGAAGSVIYGLTTRHQSRDTGCLDAF